MDENLLKKPVHAILVKPTLLEKLANEGTVTKSIYGLDPRVQKARLPTEAETTKESIHKLKLDIPHAKEMRQQSRRVKLHVLHNSIPPADPPPPCDTCKTSACCVAFLVTITEDEYESGLYGDYAVKIPPEAAQQLQSRLLSFSALGASTSVSDKPSYYLEGKMGEPCPFLQPDKKCGIYEIRPITCRTYSCVNDPRITEAMRQGD